MTRHEERKIVKNTFVFTGALLVQKLLSFLYFFYLSSRMSPATLGSYVWALSFTTLFSIGTDLGLTTVFTREAARKEEEGNKLLQNVLGMKLPLILGTAIFALLTVLLTGRSSEAVALVAFAAVVMSLDAVTAALYGSLRARQNIIYESAGIILFQIIVFGAGALFWEATNSIVLVMLALVLGSIVNMVFAGAVLKIKLNYFLAPRFDKPAIRFFLRTAPAFAATGIFIKIYNAADSVLLGFIAGDHAVGIYSIPAKVTTALQALIPGAFAASIFPSMSNYYVTSRERLAQVFKRSMNYLLVLAAPIGVGLATVSAPVLRALWPSYIEAYPSFVVMGLGLPLVFLILCTGSLLNATNNEKKITLHRGISTGVNVAINLALIPFLGPLGAAIAFFATNAINLYLDMRIIIKMIPWDKDMNLYMLKVLAATSVMSSVVLSLDELLTLPILVLVGILVYIFSSLAFGTLGLKDIRTIRSMFVKTEAAPVEISGGEKI